MENCPICSKTLTYYDEGVEVLFCDFDQRAWRIDSHDEVPIMVGETEDF